MASRRGLLLVRVFLPQPVGDYRELHLVVCHPPIDRWDTRLLPPPPFNMIGRWSRAQNLTGYAILTDADHDVGGNMDQQHQKPTFQVILTYRGDCGYVRACVQAVNASCTRCTAASSGKACSSQLELH